MTDEKQTKFETAVQSLIQPMADRTVEVMRKHMPDVFPRLCKDCRHMRLDATGSLRFAKCWAQEKQVAIDLVSGEREDAHYFCSTQRASQGLDSCGPQGLFFEPREKESSVSVDEPFQSPSGAV